MTDVPIPFSYGKPAGPQWPTAELAGRYVEGARTGHSPDARLEGSVLLAGDEPVAMRLDGAMLVRDAVPDTAAGVRRTLCAALHDADMHLVEPDTPLGNIVEIEVLGRRGDAWSLWACDADEGRRVLAARAAGDIPGLVDADEVRRAREAELQDTLSRLEQDW